MRVKTSPRNRIEPIRLLLADHYGDLRWWPGETPEEIAIGAVLTQNTAWSNVEKAIANLKAAGWLTFPAIRAADRECLAERIRPSGYFNEKAKKLQALADWVCDRGDGTLAGALGRKDAVSLRRDLLGVWGVGKETADAILLYAGHRRIFVVDAYTIRIFSRHGICDERADYDAVRTLVERSVPPEVPVYNAFHAHLVQLGKDYCHKRNPDCAHCPIRGL